MTATVKDFNIDKTHIRTENGDTASNRTYLTPDGDRYYKDDSWNGGVFSSFALSASDRELLHSSDMVHTTFSGPNFNDVIDCCREKRFPLSVDFDICRDFDTIEKYLDCISLLFISGDEPTLEKAKRLSAKYPNTVFIVTLGKNGSTAFSKGTAYHCAAAEVSEVTDTTGCGDSYQAGFIASYLADGNIETARRQPHKRFRSSEDSDIEIRRKSKSFSAVIILYAYFNRYAPSAVQLLA